MNRPTPLETLEALRVLLLRVKQEMMTRLHRQQPGMTFLEMRVLMLVGEGEGVSQKALVERSYVDKAQLARTVTSLEMRGWLERRATHSDRRLRCLYLSPAGQALYEQLRRDLAEVAQMLFGGWPTETARALIDAAGSVR